MKIIFIFLSVLILFGAAPVFSAELLLLGESDIRTGDFFELKVILNSEEPVNATEGAVVYPAENLELTGLREGNSLISLWIEKPRMENPGEIFFSGIIPGGWQGNSGLLFTMEFKVKKEGLLSLETKGVRVLKNDGNGTDAEVISKPLEVSIFQKNTEITENQVAYSSDKKDNEAPESFAPQIIRDGLFYDGKAMVVFSTNDKAGGIDHYEIKEVRYKFLQFLFPWKQAVSPAVLQDQDLTKTTMIKAVDKEGNVRIEYIEPVNTLVWYKKVDVWCIIIVVSYLIFYLFKKLWGIFLIR